MNCTIKTILYVDFFHYPLHLFIVLSTNPAKTENTYLPFKREKIMFNNIETIY